jgi:hypothetical protein
MRFIQYSRDSQHVGLFQRSERVQIIPEGKLEGRGLASGLR